jgi:hypothetical protein
MYSEEYMLLMKVSMRRLVCPNLIIMVLKIFFIQLEPLNGIRLNIAIDDDGKVFLGIESKGA